MRYYPVNLNVKNRPCLVVGGGGVGTRKVNTLLECGAKVTVVSCKVSQQVKQWAAENRIVLKRRDYRQTDLEGMFLVVGATDDDSLNLSISRDAEERGKLCNIADRPAACNFILPAIVSQGDLTIAISTGGQSPALAKKLRKDLQKQFGPVYKKALELLGAVRRKLLSTRHAPEEHKPLFEAIIEGGLIDLLEKDDTAGCDALLKSILGPGYKVDDLISTKRKK